MAKTRQTRGLIIGAPGSGSGKTTFTLGLIAAMRNAGKKVGAAKVGPDYIDTAFLSIAAGEPAINLDPWAMGRTRLRSEASAHGADKELLLVEGVMGLFDGSANGQGSTADLAATLGLPVLFVVDAARQSQSVAALVSGFANWRSNVNIGGIVLNNVASARHEDMLRNTLSELDIPVIGSLPRISELRIPSRHLGLVLPDQIPETGQLISRVAELVATHFDLEALHKLAVPVLSASDHQPLSPLGQHVAIAKDAAFAFVYRHWLEDWRRAGAQVSFFSPLANEAPASDADAVFLPGGYPELHGEELANADKFIAGLLRSCNAGALIYGECGGYMVLGEGLTDAKANHHKMAGLLPHITTIDRPKRVLGYRHLLHDSALPWPQKLTGHEFHYSAGTDHSLSPLFEATDALGNKLATMGAIKQRVMGSYAHVIDIDNRKSTGVR